MRSKTVHGRTHAAAFRRAPEEKERDDAMNTDKHGFRIDPRRPAAMVSALFFAFCIPMQILGYADRLREPVTALGLVFLPVLSALLMIVVIRKLGRRALWFSIIAVVIGVLGFAFKLALDPRGESVLHHVSAGILYAAIVVLWALTVLYVIRTKWVLTVLFIIPFFKHVFLDDLPVLLGRAAPISAAAWLKELSMLSFMLALFFCALAFEKE